MKTMAMTAAMFAVLSFSVVRAQDQASRPEQAAEDGAKLYATYCSDCHGRDGQLHTAPRGGPSVPDLQLLARRNQGVFPLERVEKLLSGTKEAPVKHGGIEMPLWGPVLSAETADLGARENRVHALARYLEGLQK